VVAAVSANPSKPLPVATSQDLFGLCELLYPICRSITGDGVRHTLSELEKITQLDIEVYEVPSGKQVFDWTVPKEWNLRHAYIEGPDGARVVDSNQHNLHVVGYSYPVDTTLSLEDLEQHLHSLPDTPDLIPYRTSYFDESWGFCISETLRKTLGPGDYRVFIDAEVKDGALTYGELFIPGTSDEEYLISTHICHPSLANDNLSGISVAAYLARYFASREPVR